MASMVNRPLASHFTIDVTWQSSPLIKYTENSVPRVLVYSFCMACIPHHPSRLPCTRWAGLTGRHLLEFKIALFKYRELNKTLHINESLLNGDLFKG